MNCLVVDDEPLARSGMAAYVTRTPGLSLVAACASFLEATRFVQAGNVDLILLDIALRGEDGLQCYRAMSDPPPVIFVTAFAEHALAGYEVRATDFLLKPVTYQRFLKAIEVARERASQRSMEEELWLSVGATRVRVRPSSIIYVEGMENYACVHATEGKLVALTTLASLLTKLDERRFLRVHRSFIVNIDHVRTFRSDRLAMVDRDIPIGRKYRDPVRQAFARSPEDP